MTKSRVKELAYYLFFGLMVFAKGIGLDSGKKSYYILSAAACVCIFCKLILTKYNIRQILAVGILCLIAFVAYRNSGRMGILLTVLAIIGIKDMDIKKLFRLGLAVYGCSFAATIIMAKLGWIYNPMAVHEKGGTELIRWGMGYSTGNVFHVSYFMLTVYLCYTWGKSYDVKKMLGLMAGNLAVFFYSLSYTGIAVTAFYLLLNLYGVGKEKAFEKKAFKGENGRRDAGEVKRGGMEFGEEGCAGEEFGKEMCVGEESGKKKRSGRKLSVWESILCQLPLPLCLLFSFGGPFLLDYTFMQKVNVWLQARLSFSAYYLQNQPITLFGARMKNVPNFWIIMDNGYVYILMTFGIVAFALFCGGYAVLIARYSGKKERLPELAIIFSFLLYGIMEQFISNAFMNLSLLFMGEILFGTQEEMEMGEQDSAVIYRGMKAGAVKIYLPESGNGLEKKAAGLGGKGLWPWLAGLAAGLVAAGTYLVFVPVKEYVPARLDTVLYVDAQSVQIWTENEGNTEEGLIERMEGFRDILADEEILERVIGEAGLEDRISAKELSAALEFSVPAAVQDSGQLDTFRARILELYWDISDEEYGRLLEGMLRHAGMPWSGDGMPAAEQELAMQQQPSFQQQPPSRQTHPLTRTMEAGGYMAKGGIYGERVGRSFGEDRIEHISGKEQYFVEKTGNIAKMEHYRDGVFWGLFTAAAVWLAIWLGGTRRHGFERSITKA